MSKKIIIGNWKMNPVSYKQAEKLFIVTAKSVLKIKKTDILICPPVLFLDKLKKFSRKLNLGVQNIFYEESGAYTGEISADMAYDIGARYVILGHSERRAIFGETNEDINKKIKSALFAGLVPVVCVGEKERDENHLYLGFIKEQLEICFKNILKSSLSKIIIAYEPVWAIGKNATREASPEEFNEISIFIKKVLSDKFGVDFVSKMRIIYGGSAHPKNILSFLQEGHADGFLVGRDSLDAGKFSEIINITENFK
ncbi:MAG: triose-phosphate isomerase [Patescibacteria group bacterium]